MSYYSTVQGDLQMQRQANYTALLGNAHIYRFDDIAGFERNKGSMTLLLKKVHIESMTVLSPELAEKINTALRVLSAE